MQLSTRHELVFVTARLTYRGATIEIPDVLVDTGAASTVIDADYAANAGIYLLPTDRLRRLRGVGGHEHVFVRDVERFAIGEYPSRAVLRYRPMRDERTEDGRGWARFSLDGKHRYRLARALGDEPLRFVRGQLHGERRAVFVMLNPSTANAFVVDPTIRRCVEFATRWGADVVEVVNLFAYRTPHPTALMQRRVRGDDARADAEILAACLGAHRVIAAWGNHGDHPRLRGRASAVTAMLRAAGVSLMCLDITLSGAPKHPHARGSHRIPPDREPVVWGV